MNSCGFSIAAISDGIEMGLRVQIKITPSFILPRRGEGWEGKLLTQILSFLFVGFCGCAVSRRRIQTQLASRVGADGAGGEKGRRAIALSSSR